MAEQGTILVINPGSTSTKLAIYAYVLEPPALALVQESIEEFPADPQPSSPNIYDQLNGRFKQLEDFLLQNQHQPDLIMTRGAPLMPMAGGCYGVNSDMLEDLKSGKYSQHASNLAALMGSRLGEARSLPVYINDPITTDEFCDLARISGVPEIQRKSRSHALNIKSSTRRICERTSLHFDNTNWVVCHMGGGISVAALERGRIIDVNDALLGMGPFSTERAGALPLAGLLALAYSGEYTQIQLEHKLSKSSGLSGYLGTTDLRAIEGRIKSGDAQADLILRAMLYQIAKEISAMASVLNFDLDGIVLTGGMAHSQFITKTLSDKLNKLAPVYIEAGENEGLALAEAGLRILLGLESPKTYSQTE